MIQDRCSTPEKPQGQTGSLPCFVWMLVTKGRAQYRGPSTSARLRERHRPLKRAGDPVHLVILLMSWHCSLGNSPPSPGVCPGKPKTPSPGVQGKRSKPSSNPFTPGHLFPDNLLWKPRHRSRKIQSRFPPNPSPAAVPQRNSMRSSRDPTIRLPARGVSTRPVAVQARKEKIHSEIAEQGGTETDNR